MESDDECKLHFSINQMKTMKWVITAIDSDAFEPPSLYDCICCNRTIIAVSVEIEITVNRRSRKGAICHDCLKSIDNSLLITEYNHYIERLIKNEDLYEIPPVTVRQIVTSKR